MAAVTAQMVKELRDQTGAGPLDCKKALEEHDGDFEKAKEYLIERGLAKAAKKAGREASEGRIETYTHIGGRVGVMVEVNCETDFVANTDQFQELARDLALQIAATNPQFIDVEDVPADVLEPVKEAFYAEAKEQGKPDNVIEKIVEGKLNKHLDEICLLRQPFVKDDEQTVQDVIVAAIAELGENIMVSRFERFEIGELADEE
ncbi:MAG: translation elongation factor Ts [Anaerolineae bacterium]